MILLVKNMPNHFFPLRPMCGRVSFQWDHHPEPSANVLCPGGEALEQILRQLPELFKLWAGKREKDVMLLAMRR